MIDSQLPVLGPAPVATASLSGKLFTCGWSGASDMSDSCGIRIMLAQKSCALPFYIQIDTNGLCACIVGI